MKQLRYFFTLLAFIPLVSATNAATEWSDAQKVEGVLYKEIDAWFKGDPEEILSCYALDFVGYAAKFSDPKAWDVAITSRDSMKYVASSPELAAKFDAHSDWTHKREMLHLSIANDQAIALVRQESTMPDSTARETLENTWEDVFMLAKIDGEWKITNAIWRTGGEQRVWRWLPE